MKRLVALMMCAVSLGAAAQSDDMSQQGFTQVHQSDSTIFWLSDQAFSFVEAQALAASLGAHLATFSTLAESNAVSNAINSANVLFGLYQDSEAPSYAEPAGGWTWVTGEEFNWSNWDSNQPNNTSSVYGEESVGHLRDNKKWNDVAMLYDGYQVLLETPNMPGCTSPNACNFDPLAAFNDGTCELSGCMDTQACNFNAEAACDDGSCDYSCCPGPGCCDVGTEWSWVSNTCIVANPADINLDGCVQLNDLLDLLSAYGDCGAEESLWQCGDPLSYQGYDYATVQIGNQCWFAENARYLPYVTPPSNDGIRVVVYDYYGSNVEEASQLENYQLYGALYNWPALADVQICPTGWHIPTDPEWMELETLLGMPSNEQQGTGYRGTTEGISLKSPIIAGTNETGYSGLGGGVWNWHESSFAQLQVKGTWWAASQNGPYPYSRQLGQDEEGIYRHYHPQGMAFSVRCLKDAE